MFMLPFATLSGWIAYVKSVMPSAFTFVSTSFAASTGAATIYFSSPITSAYTPVSGQKGIQFLGVPGPDLATGLPVLVLVAAYGVYRYMRRAHVAA